MWSQLLSQHHLHQIWLNEDDEWLSDKKMDSKKTWKTISQFLGLNFILADLLERFRCKSCYVGL